MIWQGQVQEWPITLGASLGVPIALFLLFEMWFLVPLPKGPVEQLHRLLTVAFATNRNERSASGRRISAT